MKAIKMFKLCDKNLQVHQIYIQYVVNMSLFSKGYILKFLIFYSLLFKTKKNMSKLLVLI